jgi:hypothetical protein
MDKLLAESVLDALEEQESLIGRGFSLLSFTIKVGAEEMMSVQTLFESKALMCEIKVPASISKFEMESKT